MIKKFALTLLAVVLLARGMRKGTAVDVRADLDETDLAPGGPYRKSLDATTAVAGNGIAADVGSPPSHARLFLGCGWFVLLLVAAN